jgi:hypothetical protein
MDSNVSAWTTGAAVFTFASLYILFVAVAAALYVLYTRPGTVPGHRAGTLKRPVIHTARPGLPIHVADAPSTPQDAAGQDEAQE